MSRLPLLSPRARQLLFTCATLPLYACAEDLSADPEAGGEASARVVTEVTGGSDRMTRVDAADAESWVYFSFESEAEVSPEDPMQSAAWDLAFQRFHIISNGGVSGSGGVEVTVLAEPQFASLTSAPADGYVTDAPDGDDDDAVADSAFALDGGWYDYDPATNRLSPKPLVYVVRATSGATYKLQVLDYYDDAGTSGHPRFVWALLD